MIVLAALPVDILTTALSKIAQLTEALAVALNIPLPHPIYTHHHSGSALIAPMYAEGGSAMLLSPISWNISRESFRGFQWISLNELKKTQIGLTEKSSSGKLSGSSSEPAVVPYDVHEDLHINPTFSQALLLLEADIISLCVKLGISPATLWPPCALLLNLHMLKEFVDQFIAANKLPVESLVQDSNVPLPTPQSPPRVTKTTFYLNRNNKSQTKSPSSTVNLVQEDINLPISSVEEMKDMLQYRFYRNAIQNSNVYSNSNTHITGDDDKEEMTTEKSKATEADDGWDVVDLDD